MRGPLPVEGLRPADASSPRMTDERQRGGLTITALRHVLGEPGLLHGVPGVRRKAFDCGDALVGHVANLDAARPPSTWTVHAPHCAMPHPTLVPVIPSSSRMIQSHGVSASTSSENAFPLIVSVIMRPRSLSPAGLVSCRPVHESLNTGHGCDHFTDACSRSIFYAALGDATTYLADMGRPLQMHWIGNVGRGIVRRLMEFARA